MKLYQWLAELCGSTVSQQGFYREFFRILLEDGQVFAREIQEDSPWSKRSAQYWIARLAKGDKEQAGLEIIKRHRKGWAGKVYYTWSPQFMAKLDKLWKPVKEGAR